MENVETKLISALEGTQIESSARRILKLREDINKMISDMTGQPVEKVAKNTDRVNFMTATEAKSYGIVDEVI